MDATAWDERYAASGLVWSAGPNTFVVDPQRDIDRVLTHVEELGLDVTHVVETHVHNDYVTGGYRASIAASLLVRAGRRPVLIDDDEQAITTLGLDRAA